MALPPTPAPTSPTPPPPPPPPSTMLFAFSSVLFSCVFVHLRWHSRQLNVSTKTAYFTSLEYATPSAVLQSTPYACLPQVTHSVFPNLLSSLRSVENMCSWFAFKFPFFSFIFRLLPCIYFSQSIGCALSCDVISLSFFLSRSPFHFWVMLFRESVKMLFNGF